MKYFSLQFLLCLLSFVSLNAGISSYFKPCENKSNIHTMRNIDFIYLINLDQRPEKLESTLNELAPYGIHPYRFSAVNGWELTLDIINDIGVPYKGGMPIGNMSTYYFLDANGNPIHDHEKFATVGRTYFVHCMSKGSMGIILSHLSVLQDAYDSGYNTIWVMEDDIQVIQDPRILSGLIEQLDTTVGRPNWDILFTDFDTKSTAGEYVPCFATAWRPNFTPSNPSFFMLRRNISSTFRKIGARYGAYSMIISRFGMKKILDFFKTNKIFSPYDMDMCVVPKINLFTVRQDVVSTIPTAISDNGEAYYLRKN